MKRKHAGRLRRLAGLLLCAALAVGTIPVSAAEPFGKIHSYTGQFADVAADAWYADSVAAVYESGLMNGMDATTFAPNAYLTFAQVVAVAARLHKLQATGSDSFPASAGAWYLPYWNYAEANGFAPAIRSVPPSEDWAVRKVVAEVLAGCLPASYYAEINQIDDGAIRITGNDDYAEPIYKLYRAGVMCGRNESGDFYPSDPITRAELAAIVARLIDPSLRVSANLTATSVQALRAKLAALTPETLKAAPEGTKIACGTLLYWDHDAQEFFESPSDGDASALVFCYKTSKKVGTYTDGNGAFQYTTHICILDAATLQVLAESSLLGDWPPYAKTNVAAAYGAAASREAVQEEAQRLWRTLLD